MAVTGVRQLRVFRHVLANCADAVNTAVGYPIIGSNGIPIDYQIGVWLGVVNSVNGHYYCKEGHVFGVIVEDCSRSADHANFTD